MLASHGTAGTCVHTLGKVTCRCLRRSSVVRTGTLHAEGFDLRSSRSVAAMATADKKAVLVSALLYSTARYNPWIDRDHHATTNLTACKKL